MTWNKVRVVLFGKEIEAKPFSYEHPARIEVPVVITDIDFNDKRSYPPYEGQISLTKEDVKYLNKLSRDSYVKTQKIRLPRKFKKIAKKQYPILRHFTGISDQAKIVLINLS